MKLSSYAKSATANLFHSWLRTLLAMLGIMIGTASVVALVSFGKLATEEALAQFKSLGTQQMSLGFSPPTSNKTERPKKINPDLLISMKNEISAIQLIAPYVSSYIYNPVTAQMTSVISTNPNFFKIMRLSMLEGRFFSALDKNQYFCVLGFGAARDLKHISPIGKQVKLGKMYFTVIGVLDDSPENSFFTENIDGAIFIPLEQAKLVDSFANLNNVLLQLKQGADIDFVKDKIKSYFADTFPGYMLNIQSSAELIKKMSAQQEIFTLLLGFIGGISLLVGGIGVMNIMLASVAERRYEIGLRLALGAQPKDIQLMFLMEASLLAIIGGAIGVVIGQIATYIAAFFYGWTFSIFLGPSILGFSVSLLISIFFGFYPAYLASQLNPIEALRAV